MAVFGRMVEDFLASDIGKYLVESAQRDIEQSLNALRDVDPEDPKAIRTAQNKVLVAQNVVSWLADAITRGHQSTQQLEEEHAEG